MSVSIVLFNGLNSANQHGLWVTDGTAAGTHELIISGAHPGGLFNWFPGGYDPDFTSFNGEVPFQAMNASGKIGFWVTDGTAAGTRELTGISGANSFGGIFILTGFGDVPPPDFTIFNGQVLFRGVNATGNAGLWVTNGTAAGTHELTGISGAGSLSPESMTVFNGEVLFKGSNSGGQLGLWVTDGTAAGTHALSVSGANSFGLLADQPPDFTIFNGDVLFSGLNASFAQGLWVTDGTAAGTHELTGISGTTSSGVEPAGMTVFNGEVLFRGWNASAPPGQAGLWVTDGTAAGTHELINISGASSHGLFLQDVIAPFVVDPEFTVFNGKVLFDGVNAAGNLGLWVTDGTAAGTHELTGISGAASSGLFTQDGTGSHPGFSIFNGEVLFKGYDTSGKWGLWATDGTAAGTHEIISGTASSGVFPLDLTVFTLPNPPAPPGTSADMILRHGADGLYEIYDIGNNAILAAYPLGQVGTDWGFVTLGGFNGSDTSDMLLRNANSGGFQVYDITNDITGSAFLGNVGLNWQAMGFGNFSSRGENDMILRNSGDGGMQVYDIHNNEITGSAFLGTVGLNWQMAGVSNHGTQSDLVLRDTGTGGLEIYNINNNQITGAVFLGTVGLDWQASGFGDFSSRNEGDMLLRNVNTGGLELYDISNNQITGAFFLGNVGLDWQFAGIGPIKGPGASDLVLRNVDTGAFEVYDITNNQITGAALLGAVGLDWQLGGFAASSPTGVMGSTDGSTSQLVQAMAGFGGSGAAETLATAPPGSETLQQTFLTTPHS
jgi:ELWxxDGT repeat protein